MTRLKLTLLMLVCAALGVISLVWMLCAILVGGSRAWNIALGYDILGNATFGGDDHQYISSRCWQHRAELKYRALVWVIGWLSGDPDHCQRSYEGEIKREAAWSS